VTVVRGVRLISYRWLTYWRYASILKSIVLAVFI
jgi:hypothetical protein